jgi:hypothetical protein
MTRGDDFHAEDLLLTAIEQADSVEPFEPSEEMCKELKAAGWRTIDRFSRVWVAPDDVFSATLPRAYIVMRAASKEAIKV